MSTVQADPDAGFLIARSGEEIKEPEIDLSNFLARQRLDDTTSPSILEPTNEPDEDEVDHSLAHLNPVGLQSVRKSMKGRVQMIEWDEELENMNREKAIADANRGERKIGTRLPTKFPGSDPGDPQTSNQGFVRVQQSNQRTSLQPDPHEPKIRVGHNYRLAFEIAIDRSFSGLVEAPPLPTEEHEPKKTEKQGMQDFLDDLLS